MKGVYLFTAVLFYTALMIWVAHNALDGATNYTIVVVATSVLMVCIAAYNSYLATIEVSQRKRLHDQEAQSRRRNEILRTAQRQIMETNDSTKTAVCSEHSRKPASPTSTSLWAPARSSKPFL